MYVRPESDYRIAHFTVIRYSAMMNWQKIIQDLGAKKVTQKQMAAACGCSQTSISEVSVGKTMDPRSSIGLALIKLAKRHSIKVDNAVSA